MSTVITYTTGTYYHRTPVNGGAATEWIPGGPRKGTMDGMREIGLVLFDKDAIAAAVGNNIFTEAKLTLFHDAGFGIRAVDICIAPIISPPQLGMMTYEDCLAMAERGCHYYTVYGAAASIKLPGYWLQMIREKSIAGVLIYQEDGEGTKDPIRFTTDAGLSIEVGGTWSAPVWRRGIGTGDYISTESQSFLADMQELLEYTNIRRAIDSIGPWIYYDPTLMRNYSYWVPSIITLQQAISDGTANSIYGKEGKAAITWLDVGDPSEPDSPTNIIMPNAAIINQIRNALEVPKFPQDTTRTFAVMEYARTYFDNYGKDFTVNLNQNTTWVSGKAPMSGMNWEYTTERGEKEKKYNRRFGFWLLAGLTDWSSVQTAKLRLMRNEGNDGTRTITLRPVKIAAMPTGKVPVLGDNGVFENLSDLCGSADCAVGQQVDIELTAGTIAALAAGTITGVGVDDHDHWTNFAASATLVITT